jgi:serine/threonine-protein kinase
MAPEQLAGQAPTPSSDLYALGVILFELLTGSRPHQANNMGELLRQVATQPAADLALLKPELPAAVSDLVAKLLNKRPVNRGDSAQQVAQALTDLLKSLDSTDSPCG